MPYQAELATVGTQEGLKATAARRPIRSGSSPTACAGITTTAAPVTSGFRLRRPPSAGGPPPPPPGLATSAARSSRRRSARRRQGRTGGTAHPAVPPSRSPRQRAVAPRRTTEPHLCSPWPSPGTCRIRCPRRSRTPTGLKPKGTPDQGPVVTHTPLSPRAGGGGRRTPPGGGPRGSAHTRSGARHRREPRTAPGHRTTLSVRRRDPARRLDHESNTPSTMSVIWSTIHPRPRPPRDGPSTSPR